MVDVGKQIAYWRESSDENWRAVRLLIDKGLVAEGLFFAHLAVEKLLKAHVARTIADVPPRSHDLVRLSEKAKLALSAGDLEFLAELNAYNLEGRYPERIPRRVSRDKAEEIVRKGEAILEWLIQRF